MSPLPWRIHADVPSLEMGFQFHSIQRPVFNKVHFFEMADDGAFDASWPFFPVSNAAAHPAAPAPLTLASIRFFAAGFLIRFQWVEPVGERQSIQHCGFHQVHVGNHRIIDSLKCEKGFLSGAIFGNFRRKRRRRRRRRRPRRRPRRRRCRSR